MDTKEMVKNRIQILNVGQYARFAGVSPQILREAAQEASNDTIKYTVSRCSINHIAIKRTQ